MDENLIYFQACQSATYQEKLKEKGCSFKRHYLEFLSTCSGFKPLYATSRRPRFSFLIHEFNLLNYSFSYSTGYCGSCWAFASAHVIDRCVKGKTGNITSISEQQILDCSTVDYGCDGGWPADTLRAFKSSKFRFVQDKDYPYLGVQGTCQTMTNKTTYRIANTYPSSEFLNSESDLIGLVATYGSVAVAVNANLNFQSYKSGIFDDPTCNSGGCSNVDHAVTIVGYNMSAPIPYWYVLCSLCSFSI